MNRVRGFGFIYWIVRDFADVRTPVICTGFMREVDTPWRHGKGLQLRTRKHTLQFGLCRKTKPQDDVEGVLSAVGGRMLDISVDEIGSW